MKSATLLAVILCGTLSLGLLAEGPEGGASVAVRKATAVSRRLSNPQLSASTSFGDTAIAHVADGAGWQTTITVLNLRTTATTFTVACFGDDGKPQTFSWSGVGSFSNLSGTLSGSGSKQIVTSGTAATLNQGWCNVDSPSDVGAFAVFAYGPSGQQVSVPASSWFLENSLDSLILAYDNTGGYSYGVALADANVFTYNGEPNDTVAATFSDQSGNVTGTASFQMIPGSHMSFVLTDKWPNLANTKGTVTFTMQAGIVPTLAGIGIRAAPWLAFTSVTMYEPATY